MPGPGQHLAVYEFMNVYDSLCNFMSMSIEEMLEPC